MSSKNSRRSSFVVVGCLALSIFVSSCGVSVPPRLAIPDIPQAATSAVYALGDMSPLVFVEKFSDVRENGALVFYENRESPPATTMIGAQVSSALANELRALGFNVSQSAPLLIRGEVRVWKAHVAGGFPAFVSGEAVFGIQVLDPANRPVYAGTYRGYTNLEEGSVDSKDIRKVLGTAMSEALKQLVKDQRLMGLLSSF